MIAAVPTKPKPKVFHPINYLALVHLLIFLLKNHIWIFRSCSLNYLRYLIHSRHSFSKYCKNKNNLIVQKSTFNDCVFWKMQKTNIERSGSNRAFLSIKKFRLMSSNHLIQAPRAKKYDKDLVSRASNTA